MLPQRALIRPVRLVRWYSKPSRVAKLDNSTDSDVITAQDLEKFNSYLKEAKFPTPQQPNLSNVVSQFSSTGRTLSDLINSTLDIFIKRTTEDVTSSDAAPMIPTPTTRIGITEREWILMSKIRLYLKTSNDEELYNVLKRYRKYLPSLERELTAFDISLIIKRLTDYQRDMIKVFTAEQSFASRLSKDSKLSQLVHNKNKVYIGVRSIIRTLSKSHKLGSLDYETLVRFCTDNLRFHDAIDVIEELETKIATQAGLSMTNALWATKIQILTRSSDKTWTLGRHDFKSNRAQLLPADYQYLNGAPTDIISLLQSYESSGLEPDNQVYNAMLLALGKSRNVKGLDSYIQHVWGIDPSTGKLIWDGPTDLALTEPDFHLLSSITLSYNYNNELVKPILVGNALIEYYHLDLKHSHKYWETLLRCTGMQSQNIAKQMRAQAWHDSSSAPVDTSLQNNTFDLLWDQSIKAVLRPSNTMVRLRLTYGSLESLLADLPRIRDRAINPELNVTTSEAAYNENLLLSCLNRCRTELMKRREFYKADDLIKRYSINPGMTKLLQRKLSEYQGRYLKRESRKRSDAKQNYDDDDSSMFGLY